MSESGMNGLTRRDFLGRSVMLAGAASFVPGLLPIDSPTVAARAATYHSFSSVEATFTEAMVNALCPADQRTPDGVSCGLAAFIDSQLAGEFGAQTSSESPLSQAEFFGRGVAAVNRVSRRRFGVPFEQLRASDARAFLAQLATGRVGVEDISLATWHEQVVAPLLVQASFSGPVYGEYGSAVFTKLFG